MGRPVPSKRAEVVFCPGRKGQTASGHLPGAHRAVPQGAARGNVAEQRETCSGTACWVAGVGGKAERKCLVF